MVEFDEILGSDKENGWSGVGLEESVKWWTRTFLRDRALTATLLSRFFIEANGIGIRISNPLVG